MSIDDQVEPIIEEPMSKTTLNQVFATLHVIAEDLEEKMNKRISLKDKEYRNLIHNQTCYMRSVYCTKQKYDELNDKIRILTEDLDNILLIVRALEENLNEKQKEKLAKLKEIQLERLEAQWNLTLEKHIQGYQPFFNESK